MKRSFDFLKRSEIPEVVRILRRAGIRLFMVSATAFCPRYNIVDGGGTSGNWGF